MPLGTRRAMWAADAYRMLSTNTRQLSSSFLRQLLGQPRIIVLGFMPPRPAVWILNNVNEWIGLGSQESITAWKNI